MIRFLLRPFSAVALALAVFTSPVAAQGAVCGVRDHIVERLESKYGETLRAGGVTTAGGHLVEVYASEDTGTWTVTYTRPTGEMCLAFSGDGFEDVPAADPEGDKL